jgi:hypothetical protein
MEEDRIVRDHKVAPIVAAAYLLVMPLLWERRAIRTFKDQHPEMNRALPPVETVEDAVEMASEEFALDSNQKQQLDALLEKPPV